MCGRSSAICAEKKPTAEHAEHAGASRGTAAAGLLRDRSTPSRLPAAPPATSADGTTIAKGETKTVAGVTVQAIAAYAIKPGEPAHPKGKSNGYVVSLGGKRIYFAGVTECVPEVRALRDIDVAFVPMNLPLERMTPA